MKIYKKLFFPLSIIVLPIVAGIVGNNKILFKQYDRIVIREVSSLEKKEIFEITDTVDLKDALTNTFFLISIEDCDPDYYITFWQGNNCVSTLEYDSKRNTFANILAGNFFGFSQKSCNDESPGILQKCIDTRYVPAASPS